MSGADMANYLRNLAGIVLSINQPGNIANDHIWYRDLQMLRLLYIGQTYNHILHTHPADYFSNCSYRKERFLQVSLIPAID
jgi:hypothetical protein